MIGTGLYGMHAYKLKDKILSSKYQSVFRIISARDKLDTRHERESQDFF